MIFLYLKNPKLFSIGIKELFEPMVWQKKKTKQNKTKQKQKQTKTKQTKNQNKTKQTKNNNNNKKTTGFCSFLKTFS